MEERTLSQFFHFLVSMHDSGVIAIAKRLANRRERAARQLSGLINRNLTRLSNFALAAIAR